MEKAKHDIHTVILNKSMTFAGTPAALYPKISPIMHTRKDRIEKAVE